MIRCSAVLTSCIQRIQAPPAGAQHIAHWHKLSQVGARRHPCWGTHSCCYARAGAWLGVRHPSRGGRVQPGGHARDEGLCRARQDGLPVHLVRLYTARPHSHQHRFTPKFVSEGLATK
jgi:hypothetical protein